jgi:hypothetical protein
MALKNLYPTLVVGVRIYKTAVDSVDSVFPVSGNRSIPTVNHVEHSNFVNRPPKMRPQHSSDTLQQMAPGLYHLRVEENR